MTTFTYTVDFSSNKRTQPKISNIQFGDGYSQRIAQGLNHVSSIWSVTFVNRDLDEATEIEEFFIARGATEAFDWTPPREETEIKVICTSWERSFSNPVSDTIRATFEQVFDP